MTADDDFKEYEQACARISDENKTLLEGFKHWLVKGLAEKTIKRHIENIGFYINDYLLYYDAVPASKGADFVLTFFGDWFPRKALWASPTSVREMAASLKKFYSLMHEAGHIDADDLDELKESIKEGMPDWLEEVADNDDSW